MQAAGVPGRGELIHVRLSVLRDDVRDEVMALYLPTHVRPGAVQVMDEDRSHIAALMVDHAQTLLRRIGYGSPQGPEFEVGVGLDFGEVFVGNIGDQAAGGEVVVSARLAQHLATRPSGEAEQLALRGKVEPVAAFRLTR